MYDATFKTARFIDDTFEQPRDGLGAQRSFHGDVSYVLEHLLLPLRLVNLDPLSFLRRPISHATRARSFSRRTRTSSTRSMSFLKSSSRGMSKRLSVRDGP